MRIKKYLEQSPVFAINLAYEAIISELNRSLKQEEVNIMQALLLTALFFEESDNIKPSDLAKVFRTSRGNISHSLSHLEAKKWVRRKVHIDDARSFHIELRPEGRRKALALIKFFDKIQDRFEKELGSSCRHTVNGIFQMVELHGSR
ncbi:MAG TPA: MarR family transcriptional regulator [Bdellovibrio sp.]|nr:MarR family transcriptional regulator [Bdellovibrio sp.]